MVGFQLFSLSCPSLSPLLTLALVPRFHANLSKEKIPDLILYEPDGSFVIRESSSEPGCYALSYVFGRSVRVKSVGAENGQAQSADATGVGERLTCLPWKQELRLPI